MSISPSEFAGRLERAASDLNAGQQLLSKLGLIGEASAKRNISEGPNKAVKTGNLRRSITNRVVDRGVYVGTAVEYAVYVHDGTKYMRARPFLKDGIQSAKAEIIRTIEEYGRALMGELTQ